MGEQVGREASIAELVDVGAGVGKAQHDPLVGKETAQLLLVVVQTSEPEARLVSGRPMAMSTMSIERRRSRCRASWSRGRRPDRACGLALADDYLAPLVAEGLVRLGCLASARHCGIADSLVPIARRAGEQVAGSGVVSEIAEVGLVSDIWTTKGRPRPGATPHLPVAAWAIHDSPGPYGRARPSRRRRGRCRGRPSR